MAFKPKLWHKIFIYSFLLVIISQVFTLGWYLFTYSQDLRVKATIEYLLEVSKKIAKLDDADFEKFINIYDIDYRRVWVEDREGQVVLGGPWPGMTAEVRELAAKRRYVQPGVVALVLNTAEPSMVFMFDIERHGRPAVLCFNWRRASLVVYWGVFVQGVFGLIALSLALSLWTAKRVSRPLQDLRAQVLKIASGDLALRLPEAGEDEVADVSRAVNCLTDNLSRHMAGFKQLMANMSHEMRTAVANLSMSLETMAEIGPKSAGEPPDAESEARLADHLAQARLEVELLENMVASGLLGGKLDLRHEELEAAPLDFSSLCRQVARRHDFRAALKNVAWRSDIAPDLWLVGDEILLDRLLSNIFDNAFKYTEKSGEINFYLKADDEYLIIICQNTYKLLTEEQIKSLCLPYYRLEQGQIYGTGLGLYLVHKIVELHNGLIDISNYDCGLKFTVKLPLSQRQAEK